MESHADDYYAIEAAINTGDIAYARELLREAIRAQPTAHVWYLASLIASSTQQRIHLLNKALEIDPNHTHARMALDEIAKADTLNRRPEHLLERLRRGVRGG